MNDWWSRKLSNQPSPPRTPPSTMPARPGAIQFPAVAQPVHQVTPQEAPHLTSDGEIRMGDAIRSWQGGEASRKETQSCPECNSHLVFSRAKGTTVNGYPPAPRCYSCGWNGKYMQADQASWAV